MSEVAEAEPLEVASIAVRDILESRPGAVRIEVRPSGAGVGPISAEPLFELAGDRLDLVDMRITGVRPGGTSESAVVAVEVLFHGAVGAHQSRPLEVGVTASGMSWMSFDSACELALLFMPYCPVDQHGYEAGLTNQTPSGSTLIGELERGPSR